MSLLARTGMLLTKSRTQASYDVPLWIFGLTQESCVADYHEWCQKYKSQIVLVSLNDVYEAMSKAMQQKFIEMFPGLSMTQLPPNHVWIQMAKICGGTLMWYKILFHSVQNHVNKMYDDFSQKPIVFVVPLMFATKFKECIYKLYSNSNVKIFSPLKWPTQEDLDNALPFGLTVDWKDDTNEPQEKSFESIFQECFAPILADTIRNKTF